MGLGRHWNAPSSRLLPRPSARGRHRGLLQPRRPFRGPRYSASVPPAASAAEAGTPYLQGAVVSLEVGSGDVLAWVGGRDFHQSRFDRVKSSRRQAGSAFKPFVYAAALRHGHYLSERLSDEFI